MNYFKLNFKETDTLKFIENNNKKNAGIGSIAS